MSQGLLTRIIDLKIIYAKVRSKDLEIMVNFNLLDDLEGEVEKFVGQPVTPPNTPGRGARTTTPSSTQATPPQTLFTPPAPPTNIELPFYSPMVSGVFLLAKVFTGRERDRHLTLFLLRMCDITRTTDGIVLL